MSQERKMQVLHCKLMKWKNKDLFKIHSALKKFNNGSLEIYFKKYKPRNRAMVQDGGICGSQGISGKKITFRNFKITKDNH